MKSIHKNIKKGIGIAFVLLVFLAVQLVLGHTVKNGRRTQELLPPVTDNPVYVEWEEGKPLSVVMKAKESIAISGFQMLLVNLSEESRGTILVSLKDGKKNLLAEQVIPVNTITPGEWFTVPAEAYFEAGETYELLLLADGSEPYFMQIDKAEAEAALPFSETVIKDGKNQESGISLGINTVTTKEVTFGDIFYYSVPFSFLMAIFLIVIILWGWEKVKSTGKQIPVSAFVNQYGNDLFLLLLFGAVCISIYARAYLKGAYITSDSAGYLREAVNLVNGNGFHYDGMAGYTDSWFANWPVLYPALIALVMLVTKTNAYLASKILAALMVGLILLVLRKVFKKDAWVYALCLTNIGFLSLTYYTWSEIPFMLFMLCFTLVLAKILKEVQPAKKWYVLLGCFGLCCFLTRYYGVFVWIITGLYSLLLLVQYKRNRDKEIWKKAVGLLVTAFLSGCLSLGYLFMNKIMNGMASGVSRSMWWDDYEKLTNDLIDSLLTEIFNVFSLQVPNLIESFPYNMKVFVLGIVFVGLALFIRKNCHHFTTESVLITMAVLYDVIFIGIRYVSSMDTFYFRFFEPASFLFSLGMVGLLLKHLRGKEGFRYFGGAVTAIIVIAVIAVFQNGGMDRSNSYYSNLTKQWEEAYANIPEKSVVIFNDIDFRASFYRPDVVDGMITPEDTFEEVKTKYYGSDFLCIREEYAKTMLESSEYEESIEEQLSKGIDMLEGEDEYVVISLK